MMTGVTRRFSISAGWLACWFLTCAALSTAVNGAALEGNHVDQPSTSTLRYVAVVSRHGSRSPLSTFPADRYPYYNKTFWPKGAGELTNYGKQQLFETGTKLRSKYGWFVPDTYYPGDTVARYNPYDRDYDSAACFMAGFYPPIGNEVWNQRVLWQPIPLYVREFDTCDVYKTCPAYKTELIRQIKRLNANSSNYKDLLSELTSYTGQNLTRLSQIYDIYDTLVMQKQNGFKLPSEVKTFFPSKIQGIAQEFLLLSYAGNNKMLRLGAGPEMKFISDLLEGKANNNSVFVNNKFYFEAAHDCTLIALLYSMGYQDPHLEIQTAAYLVFELHEDNSNYFVKVFYYMTNEEDKPKEISIPGCKLNCPLEDFVRFVDALNPPDWNKECQDVN